MPNSPTPRYRRHRFPKEVISYAVWLYFRFPLSLRMVEEMLAARGVEVTHETIRQWAEKFGREYAAALRRRAPQRGDKWHLDEVVVSIAGKKLWRAVDADGFVLDILVQSRRDKKAAKRFKSSRQAQKFLSIHDQIANLFHHPNPERQSSSIRRAHRSGVTLRVIGVCCTLGAA